MIKKILIGIVSLLVILVGIAIALPFVIPAESYKAELIRQVEQATGRKVRIDGDIKLSVFPTLAFEANDVGISNAPWAGKEEMITTKTMKIGVRLKPLLDKRVEMTGITLDTPSVHLVKDGERANWQMGKTATAPTAPISATEKKSSESFDLSQVILGKIEIKDGTFTYQDRITKQTYNITKVDVDVDSGTFDDPLYVKASAEVDGLPVKLTSRITSLGDAMNGKASSTEVEIKSDGSSIAWNGPLTIAPKLTGAGQTDISITNVKKWLKKENDTSKTIPDKILFGGITSFEQAKGLTNITIKKGNLTLDDLKALVELTIKTGGKVPSISGTASFETLNLNAYMDDDSASSTGNSSSGSSGGDQPLTWSTDQIDVSALRSANANLKISAQELHYKKLVLKPVAITLALNNGVLKLALARTALYGGSLNGNATIDGSSSSMGVAFNAALEAVQAEPFLKDFADFKRLSGTLNGNMAINSAGNSQRALVGNLNGNGNLKFTDGAIKGINLAAMVRNVTSAFKPNTETSEQKTDFSELSGSFTINNGVVHNDDLKLKSPLLRISGSGQAGLPDDTINYRLVPEIVDTLKGQGGKDDITGLQVPVLVTSPLHKPHFAPDVKSIVTEGLKNPDKIKETVKDVKEQFKDLNSKDDLKNAIKGLLGK